MPIDTTKTSPARERRRVTRWRIEVTAGPSRGLTRQIAEGSVRVGTSSSNDLVLEDPNVSRHHLSIEVQPTGLRLRDLGSKNGSFYLRSRFTEVELPLAGGAVTLGESELTLLPDSEPVPWQLVARDQCGRLLGRSRVMRELFTQIERAAASSATVLIHGETGTGKELVAEAIHELSPRRDGPFVVVDCGAIPRELIESHLFGHSRGAFSGATADRQGAFAEAHGGTLFLDEVGELETALQPKLLRALETRAVQPIGKDRPVETDVRVVAASLRDLANEVRERRMREDLFFRLSVVNLEVPPLRAHIEDIPLIADRFLSELQAQPLGAEALAVLQAYDWPGNVRQLRNVLERAAALAQGGALVIRAEDLDAPGARSSPTVLLQKPYKEAKEAMLAQFTREYLQALLDRNRGNVSAAAREAEIDRNWIVALARRLGVRIRE